MGRTHRLPRRTISVPDGANHRPVTTLAPYTTRADTWKLQQGRPDISCSGPDTIVEELISPVFADALRRLGAVLIVTDEIARTRWTEHISGGRSMSWGLSLNKMQIFNMTQYRKIVFMDADTIVFKNLDHLFGPEYPMFTGATRVWGGSRVVGRGQGLAGCGRARRDSVRLGLIRLV